MAIDLIESTSADGVVLLSGNVRFSEVSRTEEGPYPLYDFTASGLTHVNEGYADVGSPYRVAEPFVDPNFGLIEIDWEAKPGPMLTLDAIDINVRPAFEYQIPLDSLQR